MTSDRQSFSKKNGLTTPAPNLDARPAVVGRVGTFVADDGVQFAGQSVLNVVWHLHAMGFKPLLITRVGSDAEGRRIVRQLENIGIDTKGVQIDDSLPTSGRTAHRSHGNPCCAWEALDPKSVVGVLRKTEPQLLFHGVASTHNEAIQQTLNAIKSRTAVPFFVDMDLDRRTSLAKAMRRALLGVKWIRVDAEHLRELISDFELTITRSTLNEALAVQARFALEGIVVEHCGLPILGIWPDRVTRGTVSPPAEPTFLPGGRDAATAALIVGLLYRWCQDIMIERAAQFAFLAGTKAISRQVDPLVYSSVLKHWGTAESNAVGSWGTPFPIA
jgi:sugar/nucleoside kinase (ribokinase family)